jgi:outer membrane protein TolC
MHKKYSLFMVLLIALGFADAQTVQQISLPQLQEWAAASFPLLKQKALARQAALANNSTLSNNFLPQLSFGAQATWQSAVTEVPVRIPGFAPEALSRDQYRATLDVNQLVYDGGLNKQQKVLNELQALLKEEEVNMGLQQLKDRINNVYLSILLIDKQRQQNDLVLKDLDAGLKKVEAQVKNGTAYRSNLALLQSEKLKALQKDIELRSDREGLIDVLSLYTNQAIAGQATLITPAAPGLFPETDISRPELQYYKLRDSLAQQQTTLIDGRLRPSISLFANSGYGRPGLDMLKNEFSPYITTGVRLRWNISGFYSSKKERELADITRRDVQAQTENFLLNTKSQLRQQQSHILKLRQLLDTDQEIVVLKTQVKEAAAAQLEHGVITASDYLREVNAEDQARQMQALHQLQLLQALLTYSTIAGK